MCIGSLLDAGGTIVRAFERRSARCHIPEDTNASAATLRTPYLAHQTYHVNGYLEVRIGR